MTISAIKCIMVHWFSHLYVQFTHLHVGLSESKHKIICEIIPILWMTNLTSFEKSMCTVAFITLPVLYMFPSLAIIA